MDNFAYLLAFFIVAAGIFAIGHLVGEGHGAKRHAAGLIECMLITNSDQTTDWECVEK